MLSVAGIRRVLPRPDQTKGHPSFQKYVRSTGPFGRTSSSTKPRMDSPVLSAVSKGKPSGFPWQSSEAELREVRKRVTFALVAEEDDFEKVTATVDALFHLLQKTFRA